jgi:YegS/Rv2252/BmrU family lipid kinase
VNSVNSVLVLVNPAAANNSGHSLWRHLIPRFTALFSSHEYRIVETTSSEHNIEISASANVDLIISAGGDGTAHDIAQGLMQRAREDRPAFAVIPIGSGNDFAKTLGIPTNPRRALEAISQGKRTSIDVGRCNDSVFLESLSFGVDAAIVYRTVEMRKTTKSRGFLLYARAAVSAIIHELKPHRFAISLDGQETLDKKLLICAIQNGPTYGGGFRIAPNARPDDGHFDICMATNASKPYALYALTRIAGGTHEKLPIIQTSTAHRLTIDLEHEIPAQYDGEFLTGTHFEVELLPSAVDVILPRTPQTPRSTAP